MGGKNAAPWFMELPDLFWFKKVWKKGQEWIVCQVGNQCSPVKSEAIQIYMHIYANSLTHYQESRIETPKYINLRPGEGILKPQSGLWSPPEF